MVRAAAANLNYGKIRMIDIVLERHVTEGVIRLTQDLTPEDFRKQARGGELPETP